MTTLREKLVKVGAEMVRHGRDVTFQLAELANLTVTASEILQRILQPAPT